MLATRWLLLLLMHEFTLASSPVTETGILQFHLPGGILNIDDDASTGKHPVVLHVFLRIVQQRAAQYHLRGFAFASSVQDDFTSWGGGIFSMPPGT